MIRTSKRWSNIELKLLEQAIKDNKSLEEITTKVISDRTQGAILTKVNTHLNYGNYKDKNSDRTYFKSNINHKLRSTKEEMQKKGNNTPTEEEKSIDDGIGLGADIVPKIVDNTSYYKGSLDYMLHAMKENRCLHL